MSYNVEDSDQIKYNHFQNLTTLADLLDNYNSEGWFTRSAVRSMMYSSGYTQIANTDRNLVKIFDEDIIGGVNADLIEGYNWYNNSINYRPRGKYFIDNIADEKYDDLEFKENDIQEWASDKYTYLNAGCDENIADVSDKEIATFVRYNHKLTDLDIAVQNLIRTSATEAERAQRSGLLPKVYVIKPGMKEEDVKAAIKKLIEKYLYPLEEYRTYTYPWSTSVKEKYKSAFETKTSEIEKLFNNIINELNSMKTTNYDDKNYVSSNERICNNIKELLKTDSVFISDLNAAIKNYSNNTVTSHSKKKEKFCSDIDTAIVKFNRVKGLMITEYKYGIGFTIDTSNKIQRYYYPKGCYKSKSVYYAQSDHCTLDFTVPNGTYFNGTLCEKVYSADYNKLNKIGLSNLVLTGVRLYFSVDFANGGVKNFENAPDFSVYATKDLSSLYKSQEQLGEIALFFRNKGDDKLYKYMINLHGYETVINNEYKTEATYFVPFIADLKDETLRKLQYEGWYGTMDSAKKTYTPGVSSKAAIKKTYIQFGNFQGDKFRINNKTTSCAVKDLDDSLAGDHVWEIDANKHINTESTTKQKIKTREYVQKGFEKVITAADLKNVVIGCFTNKKPDYNAKPSGWAYTFNPNAVKINLNRENADKYTYNAVVTDADGRKGTFKNFNIGEIFNYYKPLDENYTLEFGMTKFETDYGKNGKVVYKEINDAQSSIQLEDRLIKADNVLFKATFEGNVDYWYRDNTITKVHKSLSEGTNGGKENGPANFNNVTDALAVRVMKNEWYVNANGTAKQYDGKTTEKCGMYVCPAGYFTSGYGITYAASGLEGTETYNKFKEFEKEYKSTIAKNSSGQFRVINKSKPEYSEITREFKRKIPANKQVIGGRCVVKGFEISQEDAKKCTKFVLRNDYMYRAINKDLKPMYRALYKLKDDAEVSIETLKNSVIGKLDQTAFEILIDLRYNGGVGYNVFTKYVVDELKRAITGEETEAQREKIFGKIIKEQAKEAVGRSNQYNSRHKQFAEDVFYLRNKENAYKSTDTKGKKKLTIEVECVSNIDGYVESIFGNAFYEFMPYALLEKKLKESKNK